MAVRNGIGAKYGAMVDSDDSGRTRGTDEDEDFAVSSESEDEDEDEDEDEAEENAKRRKTKTGKVKPPHFGPGSNEIDPGNVINKGRRGSASAPSASKRQAKQPSSSSRAPVAELKTTDTKKRGREAARADLQKKKKTRRQEQEEPMSAAQVKKQNKAAKETATARAKMWRSLVLTALEDRRGQLSPQDLFQWVLGDKLANTAMWFADLGMSEHQVRFSCMV